VTVPDESIPTPEDAQPEPAQGQADQNQPGEAPVEPKIAIGTVRQLILCACLK